MAFKWSKLWGLLAPSKRKGIPRQRVMRFMKRFTMLSELTEDQEIANLDRYLKTSERIIKQLRESGAPDEVVCAAITNLMLPAAMAQRDALISKRLAEGIDGEPPKVHVRVEPVRPPALVNLDETGATANSDSARNGPPTA